MGMPTAANGTEMKTFQGSVFWDEGEFQSDRLGEGALHDPCGRGSQFRRAPTFSARVALAVLFSTAVVSAVGCSAGEPIHVTGFILSSKTDSNDNPTEVYLFDGTNEYPIEHGGKQEELLDLVDQKVQVDGTLETSMGGKKSIEVERFKRLEQ